MPRTYKPETNILRTYRKATPADLHDGLNWYSTAHTFARGLANRYSLPGGHTQAAAIIAALSPQRSWGDNQRAADHLCRTGTTWGLPLNVLKAQRLLHGESPIAVLNATSGKSGHKVRAFYVCIAEAGKTDAVCVDRHAFAIAQGRSTSGDYNATPKQYLATADAYVRAAADTPHTPAQLQAVTWVTHRRLLRPTNTEAFN